MLCSAFFHLSVIDHLLDDINQWKYSDLCDTINPLAPKIWLLILPSVCYTFSYK